MNLDSSPSGKLCSKNTRFLTIYISSVSALLCQLSVNSKTQRSTKRLFYTKSYSKKHFKTATVGGTFAHSHKALMLCDMGLPVHRSKYCKKVERLMMSCFLFQVASINFQKKILQIQQMLACWYGMMRGISFFITERKSS